MNKSLSAVAAEYKEQGVDRRMILQLFIEEGLMEDIRTISTKGLLNGISYQEGENGSRWPVYNESVQKFIHDNIDEIKRKYTYDTAPLPIPDNAAETSDDTPPNGYKYFSTIAKEMNLNKKSLEEFLISEGYIDDIHKETEKGRATGITRRTNFRGVQCLVYGEDIQRIIYNSMARINKVKPRELKNIVETTTAIKHEGLAYPYLGLDDFVILDTETTGLEDDDEVIELSVVGMDGTELFHSRFYPEKEVNLFAEKVNGLRKEILLGEPRFSSRWKEIKEAIGGKKILGHNIAFDMRLITQTLRKQGYLNASEDVSVQFTEMIDSKAIAKKWLTSRSYSLNNITTLIGITREEQHNSTDDCRMTLEFLNRLEDVITVKAEYDFVKIELEEKSNTSESA